jgi:hypothetical protein
MPRKFISQYSRDLNLGPPEYETGVLTTFHLLDQRFLTCGPRTPGGPRLFKKFNNSSQQINKVHIRKKAKSEI